MALLRLGTSAALKLKRLDALRDALRPDESRLSDLVEDARILGSLELAGVATTWNCGEPSKPASSSRLCGVRSWSIQAILLFSTSRFTA